MSKLYVPIGIPGSGKSSWTEMLPGDVVVVCPDEIRVEVAKEKLPESKPIPPNILSRSF